MAYCDCPHCGAPKYGVTPGVNYTCKKCGGCYHIPRSREHNAFSGSQYDIPIIDPLWDRASRLLDKLGI